jgi:hypothetical protein
MRDTDICSLIFLQETSGHHVSRALVLSAMKETVKFSDYDELFTQVRSYVLLGKQGYDWADKQCGEITCGETYGYVALLK